MELCDRSEKRIWTKEGESIFIIKRGERRIHKFTDKQLRKEYIRPSKLFQMAPVFFVEKKDSKKYIVQDYRYLNK